MRDRTPRPCARCGDKKRPGVGQKFCQACFEATRTAQQPYVPKPVEGPCVVRTEMLNEHGYSRQWVRPDDGPRRLRYRHVLAWEAINGPLPQGMTLDHLCFQPGCVNVDHLELVTGGENARRQQKAMRTHCLRGNHPLNPENLGTGKWRACTTCARERRAAAKAAG